MMDCRTFALLLDKPEGEWTASERQQMEAHAAECGDCAVLLSMRREMRAMEEETQVPAAFTASWKNAIDMEAQKKMKGKFVSFPWKRAAAAVAAAAVLAIGTTATYLNNRNDPYAYSARQQASVMESADYDMEYEDAVPMQAATGFTPAGKRAVSNSAMYSTSA
ncbi:MAG: hypothetical protein IJ157_14935, partial [Clostridia bacterium]|nr:hypothetical protein [Clostridia bacterium]